MQFKPVLFKAQLYSIKALSKSEMEIPEVNQRVSTKLIHSHIQQTCTEYVIPTRGTGVPWFRVWIPKPVYGYESSHLLAAV